MKYYKTYNDRNYAEQVAKAQGGIVKEVIKVGRKFYEVWVPEKPWEKKKPSYVEQPFKETWKAYEEVRTSPKPEKPPKPKIEKIEVPYVFDYTKKIVYLPTSAKDYKIEPPEGYKIVYKDIPELKTTSQKVSVEQQIEFKHTIVLPENTPRTIYNRIVEDIKAKGYKYQVLPDKEGRVKITYTSPKEKTDIWLPSQTHLEVEYGLRAEKLRKQKEAELQKKSHEIAEKIYEKSSLPQKLAIGATAFLQGRTVEDLMISEVRETLEGKKKTAEAFVEGAVRSAPRAIQFGTAYLGGYLFGKFAGLVGTRIAGVFGLGLAPVASYVEYKRIKAIEDKERRAQEIVADIGSFLIGTQGFRAAGVKTKPLRFKLKEKVEDVFLRAKGKVMGVGEDHGLVRAGVKGTVRTKSIFGTRKIRTLEGLIDVETKGKAGRGVAWFTTKGRGERGRILESFRYIDLPDEGLAVKYKGVTVTAKGKDVFGQLFTGKQAIPRVYQVKETRTIGDWTITRIADEFKGMATKTTTIFKGAVGKQEPTNIFGIRFRTPGKMKPFDISAPKPGTGLMQKVDNIKLYQKAWYDFLAESLNRIMSGPIETMRTSTTVSKISPVIGGLVRRVPFYTTVSIPTTGIFAGMAGGIGGAVSGIAADISKPFVGEIAKPIIGLVEKPKIKATVVQKPREGLMIGPIEKVDLGQITKSFISEKSITDIGIRTITKPKPSPPPTETIPSIPPPPMPPFIGAITLPGPKIPRIPAGAGPFEFPGIKVARPKKRKAKYTPSIGAIMLGIKAKGKKKKLKYWSPFAPIRPL
ncbi:MAG: hypothetical protein ACTSR2_01150 [Candidatus Hodarchaeales archaeon]